MKEELGVGFVQLGAVIATFYVVSGVAQTAAGFVVDRLGARNILAAGLGLYAVGLTLLGLAPSFALLFVGAAVAGLGNSVFHPADFALLNARVSVPRLGPAFSVHGIAGNLGFALAPVVVVPLALATSWRIALLACAGLACAWVLIVLAHPALRTPRPPAAPADGGGSAGWRADVRRLASPPVLLSFAFFLLYAMALLALQTYTVPTLTSLYEMPLGMATTALTCLLLGAAAGMLAGGLIAARTSRHAAVAATAMGAGAGLAVLLAARVLPAPLAVVAMVLLGFTLGCPGPSRDMIIRSIAPPNARGKVYGFVYSALDLGGFVAPVAFGLALDAGRPEWVFLGAAVLMAGAIPAILQVRGGRREIAAAAARSP
jgi:MFS family permease